VIIGICGAAGAGKDTVAARLEAAHGFWRLAFADPIYQMISAMTGLPVDALRDRTAKEALLPIGKSPRELLQSLGTEWGRNMVSEDIWIRIALERASRRSRAVISDVRFDNEAEAILAAGGSVWRVVRPGVGCLVGQTASHSSERGVSGSLVAAEIVNDGSLILLEERVDDALRQATRVYNGGIAQLHAFVRAAEPRNAQGGA
jgi:hypothetical protein